MRIFMYCRGIITMLTLNSETGKIVRTISDSRVYP